MVVGWPTLCSVIECVSFPHVLYVFCLLSVAFSICGWVWTFYECVFVLQLCVLGVFQPVYRNISVKVLFAFVVVLQTSVVNSHVLNLMFSVFVLSMCFPVVILFFDAFLEPALLFSATLA